MTDDTYYMIGGYISSSPGIRDAGYNAEEGNQFTVNLTRYFDTGKINVYHRNTDDAGTWYLPQALNVPGIDADYVQAGPLNRQREILFGIGQRKTLDLADGRGWDGSITGGSVRFDFADGWELVDRFNYTSGDADTLGLVPGSGAVRVGALLADPSVDPGAVVTGPITGAITGRPIGDNEYIQQFGAWEVRKDIESFTNDLSLAKAWARGKVTVGYYSANASTDEFWSLGNGKYQVVESGGEVVTGIACNDPAFDSCNFNYDIDATGDATTNALYGAVEFDVNERLTFDVGVRFEDHEVEYSVDEGLDGTPSFAVPDYDQSEFSWTAAANYFLTDNMGVFGRINQGSKMPYFDDFRDNRNQFASGNDLVQEVDQFEAGFKWVTDYWSLYATGFYTTVEPSFFVVIAGVTPGIPQDNEAIGLEIDANYFHDSGFSVNLNATIQDATINDDAGAPPAGVDGNQQQRQPDWQLRISPSYDFELGGTDVTVYGTLSAVDDRFSDQGNTVVLDSYEKIDLGAIVQVNERLSFQLSVDNLTDEEGLTEGDPRNPAQPNGRFILPRSVRFSVGYSF